MFTISIVNDNIEDMPEGGIFEIEIITFKGKSLATQVYTSFPSLPRLNNTIFNVSFENRFLIQRTDCYVRARFIPANSASSDDYYYNYYFYSNPIEMNLPRPEISLIVEEDNTLTLSTKAFAMYVYIYVCANADATLRLSENYFHLSPGWPVKVEVLSNHLL